MGLFGLFSKESKEEKAFWKSYKAAYSSKKEKNLRELENALKAYPSGWQGYLLSGLYYDFGLGKIAVDENKAKEYQFKTESAVKGTEYEGWVNNFYDWYHQDAYDRCRKLNPLTHKVRKLGIAAMHTYEHGKAVLCPKGDDSEFWSAIFMSLGDNLEYEAFYEFFFAWTSFDWEELNSKVNNTSKMIDRANKAMQLAHKNKLDNLHYSDMHVYMMGYCALNPSPYTMDIAAEKSNETTAHYGITRLLSAVNMGCTPAVHELIRLAHSSESNYDYVNRMCLEFAEEEFEILELEWVNDCLKAGDMEADRLYQLYVKAAK